MKIRCQCGVLLKASEEHYGRKVKCPKCGVKLLVEAPEVPSAVFADLDEDDYASPLASSKSSRKLTICPDCNGKVSKLATACPNCGRPLRGAAIEARFTIVRTYQHEGSLRKCVVTIDSKCECDLGSGDVHTTILTPGTHRLQIGYYGLLGGVTTQFDESLDFPSGKHLVLEFNPFGGFLGLTFEYNLSERLT